MRGSWSVFQSFSLLRLPAFISFLKIELNCIAKCVLPIDVFIAILREKIQIPISHSCLWLTLNDSGPGGREGHRESDGNILGDGGALVVSQAGISVPAQAHCSIASLYWIVFWCYKEKLYPTHVVRSDSDFHEFAPKQDLWKIDHTWCYFRNYAHGIWSLWDIKGFCKKNNNLPTWGQIHYH